MTRDVVSFTTLLFSLVLKSMVQVVNRTSGSKCKARDGEADGAVSAGNTVPNRPQPLSLGLSYLLQETLRVTNKQNIKIRQCQSYFL